MVSHFFIESLQRHLTTISAGDRLWRPPVEDQEFLRFFFFSKILVRPLPQPRPDLSAQLTKEIFNIFSPHVVWLVRLGGSTTLNLANFF